jgi:hypothetical protein
MDAVSSRTPEGEPGHCPVCGNDCRLEPSWPNGDGPCPYCGHLLWFDQMDEEGVRSAREVVLRIGTARFGLPSQDARLALARLARTELVAIAERMLTASDWSEVFGGRD